MTILAEQKLSNVSQGSHAPTEGLLVLTKLIFADIQLDRPKTDVDMEAILPRKPRGSMALRMKTYLLI